VAALTPFQEAITLLSAGDVEAARQALLAIWEGGENDAGQAAHFLAHIAKNERRFSDAIHILESSLEKLGKNAGTLAQLSELYMAMGNHHKAIEAATLSLEEAPDNAVTALNKVIWQSNYSEHPLEIREAFEQWSSRYLHPASSDTKLQTPAQQATAGSRPLRVGYMSGDLGNHPVRYLIEPYLRLHDASQFEIHAFMTSAEDEVSQFLKEWVPHWHNVAALGDDALLGLIRSLEIDILVDLSGHTEASKLEVFAARAAPVQVTWWGFVHTLGIDEIDYRLTDFETCPPGTEAHYTEALCRMACLTAYAPPVNCENQYPSPWRQNGYVTMISLNHTRKLSQAALDCWRDILVQNPNSGLIVVTSEATETDSHNDFTPRLIDEGFPMDRVSVLPRLSMLEYMNVASVADFALDSFPVSGGVSTLHALWMGLPVLTMTPNKAVAMQTYSGNTLRLVGLDTCVTRSPQEVVARAGEWIQNPALIDALRERTRSNLLTSPFMDHETRVRELESCFREMWRRFLHNEPVTDLSVR
jgi:protein O-GlcNAc transferase